MRKKYTKKEMENRKEISEKKTGEKWKYVCK